VATSGTGFADLEIRLQRVGVDTYDVGLRFSPAGSDQDQDLAPKDPIRVRFDVARLRQLGLDPEAYGAALTECLFVEPVVQALEHARTSAAAAPSDHPTIVRLRLYIPASAPELHSVRWETLHDPETGTPLVMSERLLFSRYLSGEEWRRVQRRSRSDLRALVVIANPGNITDWKPNGRPLAQIDVPGELARARTGLDTISIRELISPRATLDQLCAEIRDGVDILYLVCHGALKDEEPLIYLDDGSGGTRVVNGRELVVRLRELGQLPRLAVLASCQSAGDGRERTASDEGALSALGPQLAAAGVPAVIAMQGNITMATVETLMPVFFEELRRDGQIDRAMAVARAAVRDRRPDCGDWWMPVLFMRLRSGQIWYSAGIGGRSAGFFRWTSLLDSIRDGKCTPILGPGLSESLLGSRRELARRLARRPDVPLVLHERDDLPQVAQVLAIDQGSSDWAARTLVEQLREEMLDRYGSELPPELKDASLNRLVSSYVLRRQQGDENEPHRVLARLPFPIYVTTQAIDVLAESLRALNKEPRVSICQWALEARPERFPKGYQPDKKHPLVYHAFGHADHRATLVLTEDDYFNYLIRMTGEGSRMPTVVKSALSGTSLLFLGFQVDDWNFRVLFHSIMSMEGGGARSRYLHVAVQVEPDEEGLMRQDRARHYLEIYFQGYQDQLRNISVFWGSVEDFVAELRSQAEANGVLPRPGGTE
jgi:hypothetical protein